MGAEVLLGDEAVALGAVHAGVTASYAYPGTPSTEISEFLLSYAERNGAPHVEWCANEKTAYEAALGTSLVGRRALVSMKHVGLNVAADPFINSALVPIHGGLVLAVADDPGMHSSQNEQDTRFYADFAKVPCLEPRDQQQAYEMTREAFDLSERFGVPVIVRLVTRLAHSRARVDCAPPRGPNAITKAADPREWILLPANARRNWNRLLESQHEIEEFTSSTPYNVLDLDGDSSLGVITTGIAGNYYEEARRDLSTEPLRLQIGAYPIPVDKIRRLAAKAECILLLEEGYPMVERLLRGLLPPSVPIHGKMDGRVPAAGELTPEIARAALGLAPAPPAPSLDIDLPVRPPQLCKGCPHADSYHAIKEALDSFPQAVVTADIGCYTLGALPPYSAIESCVCMGASVGMAKGAADAGLHPAVGVIGDSTFLHSGIPALLDAATADSDMTLVILDNGTVGMTGGQPTAAPASALEKIVLAVGVSPAHLQVVEAHPKKTGEIADVLRDEMEHAGTSVVIARRECIESIKQSRRRGRGR